VATAALDEIRRIIRDGTAEALDAAANARDKLTEVAKRRQTEPLALNRLVRGDLDG